MTAQRPLGPSWGAQHGVLSRRLRAGEGSRRRRRAPKFGPVIANLVADPKLRVTLRPPQSTTPAKSEPKYDPLGTSKAERTPVAPWASEPCRRARVQPHRPGARVDPDQHLVVARYGQRYVCYLKDVRGPIGAGHRTRLLMASRSRPSGTGTRRREAPRRPAGDLEAPFPARAGMSHLLDGDDGLARERRSARPAAPESRRGEPAAPG